MHDSTLLLALLTTAVLLFPAAASQAAGNLEFRVPAQVSDIENLEQVHADCLVSTSPLRTEIDDEVDYSDAATIRTGKTVRVGDDAGGSWSGTMELDIGDRSNGATRIDEARHYVCKLTVGYLKTGNRGDGISQLSDGNCDHEVQYIEPYRDSMNADVAAHVLCRQGPLEPGRKVVDVGSMYLRGGTPTADEIIADLTSRTSIEPRSKRVGPRYASFSLEGAGIEECALACVRDDECRSWSGWEARGGHCFLSSAVLPATPVDYSFAYSGSVDVAKTTVEPEPTMPGPTAPAEAPVSDAAEAVAAAIKAMASGEPCHGAEVLRPFLDDPQARAMHEKLWAACGGGRRPSPRPRR